MDKVGLVSLTFDDGLRCQFERAVPILDLYGFPATFFFVANTDPIHKIRASGSSVGKNSTVQSQSVSSWEYGWKSSLRFILKSDRFPIQAHSDKTRGTRTVQPKDAP